MPEYIERDAAIKAIRKKEAAYDVGQGDALEGLYVADREISACPAVDVAPVVHGRWEIVIGSDGKEHMVCTECRKQQDLTGVFSYCPNCGAKMDGEGNA